MVIKLNVAIDTTHLDNIQATAKRFPDLIERYAKRDIAPYLRNEVTKRLRREPGVVVYPIEWTSERQRLAFFASDGFGHGIPYQRSGQLIHDWHVIGDYRGGLTSIRVFNDNPAARYIYGDEAGKHQQQFHKNTGWPTFVDVLQILSLEVNDRIEDGWGSVITQALDTGGLV